MAERITNLSIEQYHADRSRLTSTALRHAARWDRGKLTFTAARMKAYLDGSEPLVDSPALDFGSAFHALREGLTIDEIAHVFPRFTIDKKTGEQKILTRQMTAYKEWRSELEAKHGPDVIDFSHKESENLRDCHNALKDSPIIRELLEDPAVAVEGTIRWEQGLKFQVRPDTERTTRTIDWKTDADPHTFPWRMYSRGLHRSAALQVQGVYEASGEWKPFVHVVVGKKKPHDIMAYEMTEKDLDLGMLENLKVLAQVQAWMYADAWEDEWDRKVLTVGMPDWDHRNSEIALIDEEYGNG